MNADELKIINETQDEYENILVKKLLNKEVFLKTINFTSPTGTGKTKMMADLINKLPDNYYFVITTLSRGQLNKQIKNEVKRFCKKDNYVVYGLSDYTKNTILQKEDVLKLIPKNKKLIWFRDEGHIHTNRWFEILEKISYKTVNFSATNVFNSQDDVNCNFAHTMMLRTLKQQTGTPENALDCLIRVKAQHKKVKNYNPCAIFRILDDRLLNRIIIGCKRRKLKYINITTDDYDMSDICQDNNEYDVVINKFKIIEGVDIRRAHVLYMTNEPKNPNTTIQLIGRCRRNALLYRDDIDILNKSNKKLLKDTRICYAFYNISNMDIDQDENGNLVAAFCDRISVQNLKSDIKISLEKGALKNGLKIIEANGQSGEYEVKKDKETGFNVLYPDTGFYQKKIEVFEDNITYFNNLTKKTESYSKKDLYENWNKYYSNYFWRDRCCYAKEMKTGYVLLCINKKEISGKLSKLRHIENLRLYLIAEKSGNTFTIKENIRQFLDIGEQKLTELLSGMQIHVKSNNIDCAFSRRQPLEYDAEQNISGYYTAYILRDFIKQKIKNKNKISFSFPLKQLFPKIIIDASITMYDEDTKKEILPESIDNSYGSYKSNFSLGEIYQKFIDNELKISRFLHNSKLVYDFIVGRTKLKYPYPKERNFIRTGEIDCYYDGFKLIQNDRETAILGAENFKILKIDNNYEFIEDKTVTSKISKNTKFNQFISTKYADILNSSRPFLFKYKSNLNFKRNLNSAFGYCVEYFAKELIFKWNRYFSLKDDRRKAKAIRYAIDVYKSYMGAAFNIPASIIKCPSFDSLMRIDGKGFVNSVINLGTKTSQFIKKKLKLPEFIARRQSPILSVDHIAALADFIIGDTIIDVKCTAAITEQHIRQVLAYHYLSTRRSDLNIKRLIIYEAITGKYIEIQLDTKEVKIFNTRKQPFRYIK